MLEQKLNEWGVNLLLRVVLSILAIHFLNLFLIKNGNPVVVGINCYTLPIMAILGLPGLVLLYSLALFL